MDGEAAVGADAEADARPTMAELDPAHSESRRILHAQIFDGDDALSDCASSVTSSPDVHGDVQAKPALSSIVTRRKSANQGANSSVAAAASHAAGALSHLYNPFKLLDKSPIDGSFGVTSAALAAIRAQEEWDAVCEDWRLIKEGAAALDAAVAASAPELPPHQRQSSRLSLQSPPQAAAPTFTQPALASSDDNCGACLGRGSILLCCDSCPRVFHFCCVEEAFSADGSDAPASWECKNCSWKRRNNKLVEQSSKRPKSFSSAGTAFPTSAQESSTSNLTQKISSAFAALFDSMDASNPRRFDLPRCIVTAYEGVYSHPVTGDYVDLSEVEVVEIVSAGGQLPTGSVYGTGLSVSTRRMGLLSSAASAAITSNGPAVSPAESKQANQPQEAGLTPAAPPIQAQEWVSRVTTISGSTSDWAHDAHYLEFEIPKDVTGKPSEDSNPLRRSWRPPPFSRNLPLCYACGGPGPQFGGTRAADNLSCCDACGIWWHASCVGMSSVGRRLWCGGTNPSSPWVSLVPANRVECGQVGRAACLPPTSGSGGAVASTWTGDVSVAGVVVGAGMLDLKTRCWGRQWDDDDRQWRGAGGRNGAPDTCVWMRRRWICPLHAEWAYSQARVLRPRKRRDCGRWIVDCDVASASSTDATNPVEWQGGNRKRSLSADGAFEFGSVVGLAEVLRDGRNDGEIIVTGIEDDFISSPGRSGGMMSAESENGDDNPTEDANSVQKIVEAHSPSERRKIRTKADPIVLAVVGAQKRLCETRGDIVVDLPMRLNEFQKTFGPLRGSSANAKKKRKHPTTPAIAAAPIVSIVPENAENTPISATTDTHEESSQTPESTSATVNAEAVNEVEEHPPAVTESNQLDLHPQPNNLPQANPPVATAEQRVLSEKPLKSAVILRIKKPRILSATPESSSEFPPFGNFDSVGSKEDVEAGFATDQSTVTVASPNSDYPGVGGNPECSSDAAPEMVRSTISMAAAALAVVSGDDLHSDERLQTVIEYEAEPLQSPSKVSAPRSPAKESQPVAESSLQSALPLGGSAVPQVAPKRGRGRPRKVVNTVITPTAPKPAENSDPHFLTIRSPDNLKQENGSLEGSVQPGPTRPEKVYKCTWPNCNMSFPERWRLKTHVNLHTKEFICVMPNCKCGGKAFISKYHLERHSRNSLSSTEGAISTVELKGTRMSHRQNEKGLDKGEVTERVEGRKEVVCAIKGCGRLFTSKYFMVLHMRGSHEEKPVKSDTAESGKSENNPPVSGIRCGVDGCQRVFMNSASLVRHRDGHYPGRKRAEASAVTDFVCPHLECRKRFQSQWNLTRHVGTVHREGRRSRVSSGNSVAAGAASGGAMAKIAYRFPARLRWMRVNVLAARVSLDRRNYTVPDVGLRLGFGVSVYNSVGEDEWEDVCDEDGSLGEREKLDVLADVTVHVERLDELSVSEQQVRTLNVLFLRCLYLTVYLFCGN
ncbi:hypothetical protein HDU84_009580 [Entophlyctis sp. JEL0112]|nr:hypothetical protein HDU84_009580 [Entophlyctis sp. JEL0112]